MRRLDPIKINKKTIPQITIHRLSLCHRCLEAFTETKKGQKKETISSSEISELTGISSDKIRKDCRVCLIGSSLGGYYATWLAEQYDCRAVLINPAVRPYDFFEEYLGFNTNYYTAEQYELTMDHIEQLREIEVEQISNPDRYLMMLQTGDEVLDYNLLSLDPNGHGEVNEHYLKFVSKTLSYTFYHVTYVGCKSSH